VLYASGPQSWFDPASDKWCRASPRSARQAPPQALRWPRFSPGSLGASSRSCAEITSSRSIPRCARFQPRDQIAQRSPRDEQWQTTLVSANVHDGTTNRPKSDHTVACARSVMSIVPQYRLRLGLKMTQNTLARRSWMFI
jgi:hypothetical protein